MEKQSTLIQEKKCSIAGCIVPWAVIAVISELVMFLLERYYVNYTAEEAELALIVAKLVSMGFCLGLIALLVGLIYRMKRWDDYDSSGIIPVVVNGCIVGGALVAASFLAIQIGKGAAIQILRILIPVAAVLVIIGKLVFRSVKKNG